MPRAWRTSDGARPARSSERRLVRIDARKSRARSCLARRRRANTDKAGRRREGHQRSNPLPLQRMKRTTSRWFAVPIWKGSDSA